MNANDEIISDSQLPLMSAEGRKNESMPSPQDSSAHTLLPNDHETCWRIFSLNPPLCQEEHPLMFQHLTIKSTFEWGEQVVPSVRGMNTLQKHLGSCSADICCDI